MLFLIASVSGKFITRQDEPIAIPLEPRQDCPPPHCGSARGDPIAIPDGPIVIPYQVRGDPIAIPDEPIAIPDGPVVIPYQNKAEPPIAIPFQVRDDPIAIPDEPIAIPYENKEDCPPPHCKKARGALPLIHF